MSLDGTWKLEVATPFGTHPATLVLDRNGGTLNGHIDSKLGNTPLKNVTTASEDQFRATASMTFQGRTFEADITGQAAGDQLDGKIDVKFPLAPTVKFTGTRLR
ncbi:MAG TPA: hypothetical protein VF754_09735 [Pyrinomonadaceae bacterium]